MGGEEDRRRGRGGRGAGGARGISATKVRKTTDATAAATMGGVGRSPSPVENGRDVLGEELCAYVSVCFGGGGGGVGGHGPAQNDTT